MTLRLTYEEKNDTAIITVSKEPLAIQHSLQQDPETGEFCDEVEEVEPLEIQHSLLLFNYRHEAEAIAEGLGAIAYFNQNLYKLYVEFEGFQKTEGGENWTTPHPVGSGSDWAKVVISQIEELGGVNVYFHAEAPGTGKRMVGDTIYQALGFLLLSLTPPEVEIDEKVTSAWIGYHQFLMDKASDC